VTDGVELVAEARELAKAAVLDSGELRYPDEALGDCFRSAGALPSPARARVAGDLIALAVKLQRTGGERAGIARAQLVALASVLGLSADKLPTDLMVSDAEVSKARDRLTKGTTARSPVGDALAPPPGHKLGGLFKRRS